MDFDRSYIASYQESANFHGRKNQTRISILFAFMKRLLLLLSIVGLWQFADGQCPPAGSLCTPLVETFEGQAAGLTSNTFTNCWVNTSGTTQPRWESEDATGSNENSTGTGPFTDNTLAPSAGGIYIYLETSGGAAGDTAGFMSPDISLTGLTNPQLEFYYHMYGATMGELEVQIWNGVQWDSVWAVSGQQQALQSDPFLQATVSLAAYTGTIKVKFLGTRGTSFTGDIAIDDIRIDDPATCPNPSNLAANGVGSTQLDFVWNPGTPGATAYEVRYGTLGTVQCGAGGTLLTPSTDSVRVTGLMPATTYEFFVREACSGGGFSQWVGPLTVTTACAAFTSPYSTGFDTESDGSDPLCWAQYNNYSTSAYARVETPSTFNATQPVSPTNFLEMYSWTGFTAGVDTLMAITPQFSDMTASDKQIRFEAATQDNQNSLYVGTMSAQTPGVTLNYIDTITFPTNNVWQTVIILLDAANGYNGTDEYVFLQHSLTATFDDIYIDDFNYEPIPSCPLVTAVNVTGATFNSATFNYNNPGTAVDIEWGASGFTPGTGCMAMNVPSGSPITINDALAPGCATSLAPQTTYDFYVRNNCGAGGVSAWSGPFSFTTACAPVAAPYNEDFETGYSPGSFGPSISACLFSQNTSNPRWEVEDASGANENSSGTGPFYDNTLFGTSGGHYLYLETSGGAQGDNDVLTTPFIDISSLSVPFFGFSYHMYGAAMGTLRVEVWDNGSWTAVDSVVGQQQTAGSDPWVSWTDTLNVTSDTIQIRFVGVRGSSFTSDMSIDDLFLIEAPSCSPPANLGVTNVTGFAADIYWTTGGASNWQIEYGVSGFTPGSGTLIPASNDTITLSGLTPGTAYSAFVRDSCGVGQVSLWAGPVSFSTLCAPLATPYSENFESGYSPGAVGPAISACFNSVRTSNPRWEVEDASGSNENSTGTGPLYDNTTPGVAGGHYLYLETSGGAGLSDTLTTPEFDVSGLTLPYFEFAYHMHGATMGDLDVEVWDGATWSPVVSYSGQQQALQSDAWLISGTPINGLTSTTIRFRFIGTSGSSFTSDMALDDIAVYEAPSCFKPTAPGVVTTDDQSATIYWTGGGASNWQVQYGPAGFVPGTGTIVASANDTLTITGLTAATAYEFYVRDSCAVGDVSLWTGPTAFTTTPCAASATCTYSAELFDSFGDGWNGAQVTVWQGGVPVATLGSGFTTGGAFTESFDVCDGLMTYVTLSAAGGFPSEVGIYVRDRAGDTVVAYPNSFATAQGDTLGMFTVDCSKCPVFAAPFMETFEANSQSASCWTNEYVADTRDWTIGTGAGGGVITSAYAGTQNAVFVSSSGGPDITRYVSPAVDISALSAPELRFWYGQEVWFSDQNYLNVYYRTDTSSAWMLLWSDSTNQPAWTEGVVALPMPSATYQVAFEGINDWGRANVLDNVSIMDAPNCPAPTALGVTNVTNNSADIYWTTGGASNWLVRYDDGTTTNIVASANDTITLTGLTAGTGYTVFVKDSCAAGDVSVWAGPVSFTTALCAPTNSCNYSAQLSDSFGDGWNGTEVTVYQGGVAVAVLGTGFTTGTSFGPVSVPLCDGLMTYFVITTGSNGAPNYAEEIGIDLDDPYGTQIASYPANPAAAQGDTVISLTANCAPPACAPVTGLGATNITTTSADLYWTGVSGAMMYNVQYGVQGFTPGTGTIVNTANDTLSLTGINASQCYDFWVQTDCGTDSSIYVGPFTFCTLCAAISSFPYTEGFNSVPVTNLPACYADSATNANGAFTWYVDAGGTTSSSTGPGADADGSATGNYVYTEASSPAATGDSAFLFLPEFDITSLTTPELVFAYHLYGADITTLTVEYFDMMSSTWMALDSIVGQQQTSSVDPWQEYRINLNAVSSANLMLRFMHVRGASFNGDAAIDNVTIRETPLCVDPTGLMVTGTGQNSISLSWMTDTNITASAVQYGAPGFALGSGTTVGSMAGMATVTGLMANTCYDFYVLDSCGSATNWVGPVTACTKPGCGVSGIPTNVSGDSTGCGGGGVTMTATPASGNQVGWFVNGQLVGSGSPYIDTIGVTTTYEARNVSRDGSAYHLGPLPSIAASGFGNFTNGQYITVTDTLIIDSTTVRSNGYVRAQVIITDGQSTTDGGNILQRGEIFTTDSNNTVNTQVPVGIVLTPGQYFIGIDFLPGTVGALFRATGGAVYPYTFPGLMSIDSVNFAGPRYYYTFDLVIQNACIATNGVTAIGYVPGANAGMSDSVVVCETETAVDLTQFLGTYDVGGTWSDDDATGALTDSIFDASAVTAGGTYNFTYIVSQSGGCVGGDTATISVTVEASPFAGADTADAICITGAPVQLRSLLPGSDNGGTMIDVDGSGALVGTLFLPGNLASAGTYRFTYVVAGSACADDSATITLTVDDAVDAGMDATDTITDCDVPVDLNSYLSANATAGGTWVDVSGSGALTGSTFDPNQATNMATYDFRYVLTSACGDDSATVSLYLDCDVSLNEYTVGNIDVYPNPTVGAVTIEALGANNRIRNIEVYAINGELLIQRNADDAEVRLDLSNFADGLYNIKVTSDLGVELHRINKK